MKLETLLSRTRVFFMSYKNILNHFSDIINDMISDSIPFYPDINDIEHCLE